MAKEHRIKVRMTDTNVVVLTGTIAKKERSGHAWFEFELAVDESKLTVPFVAYGIDFGSSEANGLGVLELVEVGQRTLLLGRVDAGAEGAEIRALRLKNLGPREPRNIFDDIHSTNIALMALIEPLAETFDRRDILAAVPEV